MHLLSLPDELLVQILSYSEVFEYSDPTALLRQVTQTCRHFNAIATRIYYTNPICIDPFSQYSSSKVRNTFVQYLRRLEQYPERASWAHSAHFIFDLWRLNHWDEMLMILPKLQSLHTLRLQSGKAWEYSSQQPDFSDWQVDGMMKTRFMPPRIESPSPDPVLDKDRNWGRLISGCNLNTLRQVVLDVGSLTVDEVVAFVNLPNLETLEAYDFGGKMEGPVSSQPSNLATLKITGPLLPNGVETQCMFKPLTKLRELSWTFSDYRWVRYKPTVHPPLAPEFSELLNCHTTLTTLHLLLGKRITSWNTQTLPQIDLTRFSTLKKLEISSRILSHSHPSVEAECGSDLRRLPNSLESLKIVFGRNENVFEPYPASGDGYFWVIELANHKEALLPKLVEVYIVEEIYDQFRQTSWEIPESVLRGFIESRVGIEVVLRVFDESLPPIDPDTLPKAFIQYNFHCGARP